MTDSQMQAIKRQTVVISQEVAQAITVSVERRK